MRDDVGIVEMGGEHELDRNRTTTIFAMLLAGDGEGAVERRAIRCTLHCVEDRQRHRTEPEKPNRVDAGVHFDISFLFGR